MKKLLVPTILIIVVAVLIALFAINNQATAPKPSPSPTPTVRASSAGLPGLLTSTAPWPNNTAQLADRLKAIGLPALSAEGTVLHIHQHLDIFVDGQPVAIPADIGIPTPETFISPIHVHDDTAVLHVESPTQQDYYLGQVFDIWGVEFSATQLGGYVTTADKQLAVYVNGTKITSDPRHIKLAQHQEIVITYGTAAELPNPIPSSYTFPEGE